MKHDTLARWIGHDIDARALDRLERLAGWLVEEAVPAGGIGPDEADRVWERHVLDGVTFARGFPAPPDVLVDLGSGVGLPGLALAALWPEADVRLVDRSGRRVHLARRGARVVGLDNVEVVQGDIDAVDLPPSVVMRGVLGPEEARRRVVPRLPQGGRLVLGLTRRPVSEDEAAALAGGRHPGEALVAIPSEVLDPGGWLLIMTAP